jgi:hypothetical protein
VHTPGHATINYAVLGSALDPALATAIIAGAIIPDVPIMILYVRERWLRKTPEERIWSDHYQRPFWQNLIHGMHSIPFTLLGAIAAILLGAHSAFAFFASMLLHALGDLPVHAIDAHRHFIPFSQWRFISPISYWDVRYHGQWVALVEAALVFACAWVIWSWDISVLARVALIGVGVFYVQSYWRAFLRQPMQQDA